MQVQHPQHTGNNELLMMIASILANEFIIPGTNVPPMRTALVRREMPGHPAGRIGTVTMRRGFIRFLAFHPFCIVFHAFHNLSVNT